MTSETTRTVETVLYWVAAVALIILIGLLSAQLIAAEASKGAHHDSSRGSREAHWEGESPHEPGLFLDTAAQTELRPPRTLALPTRSHLKQKGGPRDE